MLGLVLWHINPCFLFNAKPIFIQINRFGLVSLFNGISTFVGYLTPMPFFCKNSRGTI